MRRLRLHSAWPARTVLLLLVAACGSRTGLLVDDDLDRIGGLDAGGGLVPPPPGPFVDGGPDVPPITDARPSRDVDRRDCPDASEQLVYVVTSETELFSFHPPSTFRLIGNLVCPAPRGESPFSMAVDRRGVAYVLYTDERLYRVSTATAACVATPFRPRQSNFGLFGMGFATNDVGPTETLYVAGDERAGSARGLARIDTSTFELTPVGNFTPRIARAELTGTGDGRLFAFYTKGTSSIPSFIGEIDPDTARVIGEEQLTTVNQGRAWAFAFWGGDFYTFTAPTTSSVVTRFRPADGSVATVATLPTRIVGAGVSTCAPQ